MMVRNLYVDGCLVANEKNELEGTLFQQFQRDDFLVTHPVRRCDSGSPLWPRSKSHPEMELLVGIPS